ncbi:MAG: hypothetical protein K2O06_15100 [Acetatifactor sp.]|nr:hypothetical protein [Acetatifactor sp.]
MGFLKKLFVGKEISAQEEARRNGTAAAKPPGFAWPDKPYDQMSEQEKTALWAKIDDLEDIREKVSNLEKLADLGNGTACLSLFWAYIRLEQERNVPIDFPRLTKYLKQAADQDLPNGHYFLARVYLAPRNLHGDTDLATDEFCHAVACGVEQAAEEILACCSGDDPETAASVRHRFESRMDAYVREAMGAEPGDDPECFQVLEAEPEKISPDRYDMFGLLYFYGIYYPQDLGRAKEFFELAENTVMLANPIFDEDDEEEE